MEKFANTFWTEKKGSGTVDWIVLTAGATFLCFGIMASMFSTYSQDVATDDLGPQMETAQTLQG